MSDGVTMVSVTVWLVALEKSAASALAGTCTEPTLSTRTSVACANDTDRTRARAVMTAADRAGICNLLTRAVGCGCYRRRMLMSLRRERALMGQSIIARDRIGRRR